MWRRPAPSARRRPISPTRSSTETSVTLAMPIAPTSSDTPPSSRNRALRSFSIAPRSRRGSGGAATFSRSGSAGLSAIGAWRAISSTAPMRGLDLGRARAPRRPNSRRAVPSGMIAAASSELWRRTPESSPIDGVEPVADEDGRLLVDPRDADPPRGAGAEHERRGRRGASAPRRRTARVSSSAWTARKAPGDAALIGSWIARRGEGVVERDGAHERAAHVDVGDACRPPPRR